MLYAWVLLVCCCCCIGGARSEGGSLGAGAGGGSQSGLARPGGRVFFVTLVGIFLSPIRF
jgi:hypothetical protein